jgi:hypothetical protein
MPAPLPPDVFALPDDLGDETESLVPLVLRALLRVATGFSMRTAPDEEASALLRDVISSVLKFVVAENARDCKRLVSSLVPDVTDAYERLGSPHRLKGETKPAHRSRLEKERSELRIALNTIFDSRGIHLLDDELNLLLVDRTAVLKAKGPKPAAVIHVGLLLKQMSPRTYAYWEKRYLPPPDANLDSIRSAFGARPSLWQQADYALREVLHPKLSSAALPRLRRAFDREDEVRRIHRHVMRRLSSPIADMPAVASPPKDGLADPLVLAAVALAAESRGFGRARMKQQVRGLRPVKESSYASGEIVRHDEIADLSKNIRMQVGRALSARSFSARQQEQRRSSRHDRQRSRG